MPEPIEYLIIRNLQTALQQISVLGGYHYTVAATAVKLDPNENVEDLVADDGPRPFILIELQKERWDYSREQGAVDLALPVTIHWVSETLPARDSDRMQTYLRGCADVEQAIAKQPARGSVYGKDTRITNREFDTAVDGSQVWAMLDVLIGVRRVYGQPNE